MRAFSAHCAQEWRIVCLINTLGILLIGSLKRPTEGLQHFTTAEFMCIRSGCVFCYLHLLYFYLFIYFFSLDFFVAQTSQQSAIRFSSVFLETPCLLPSIQPVKYFFVSCPRPLCLCLLQPAGIASIASKIRGQHPESHFGFWPLAQTRSSKGCE